LTAGVEAGALPPVNERSTIQSFASWTGTAFLVVGILGFIPGVTDQFAELKVAGHRSTAQLFGVFDVSILHNLLHVVLGIAGLWLARTWAGARIYLIGGGTLYLALWIYGLAVGRDSSANFIPVDSADNWLHFTVGLGMLAAGLVLGRQVPHQKEAASTT
jgi:Domain of unknown function (DUF4383)